MRQGLSLSRSVSLSVLYLSNLFESILFLGSLADRALHPTRDTKSAGALRGVGLLFNLRRVAGLVVFDLKVQELVNGLKRSGVLRRDGDRASALRRLELVSDRRLQFLHDRHAGRDLFVDEHWRVEVPLREHLRDVGQVSPDQVPAPGVRGVVHLCLDPAACGSQSEVVGGLGVVEPHDVIAAPRNPRRAGGFRRLSCGGHRQKCHYDSRDEFAFHTLSFFIDADSAHHKRARGPDNSRMLRYKLVAAPLSLLIWTSYVLIVILWTPLGFFYRLATRRSDPDRYRLGRFFRKSAVLAGHIIPFWKFRIVDRVHPDPRRPYVFVANHCSSADAFLIVRLPWEMKWLSKQSIMRIPR